MNHDKFDAQISASFLGLNGSRHLIRGTEAWDEREDVRRRHGNVCISFGSIAQSRATNGVSSLIRGYAK